MSNVKMPVEKGVLACTVQLWRTPSTCQVRSAGPPLAGPPLCKQASPAHCMEHMCLHQPHCFPFIWSCQYERMKPSATSLLDHTSKQSTAGGNFCWIGTNTLAGVSVDVCFSDWHCIPIYPRRCLASHHINLGQDFSKLRLPELGKPVESHTIAWVRSYTTYSSFIWHAYEGPLRLSHRGTQGVSQCHTLSP